MTQLTLLLSIGDPACLSSRQRSVLHAHRCRRALLSWNMLGAQRLALAHHVGAELLLSEPGGVGDFKFLEEELFGLFDADTVANLLVCS